MISKEKKEKKLSLKLYEGQQYFTFMLGDACLSKNDVSK
jgi:hypothetical protein